MLSYAELGLILIVSTALSAGLIAALRPALQRYALARPNARSSHHVPTPQGAGIAVIAATIGTSVVAVLALHPLESGLASLWVVLGAAAMMAAVGAIDDIRPIEVIPRLMLQTLLVAVVIASLPVELRIIDILPWWAERVLLLLGGLWFVNLVNFMDGIDWMTVAETVPVTGGLILLGSGGALPAPAVIITVALVGAIIGFAPFNRPVASVFLGDVGSLPIGLLLGWLLVQLAGGGQFAAALLLPLYYIADATITLVARAARGERVWEAHRSHFYQRAMAAGFSVPQVVARVFAVNLALVVLAAATVGWPGAASSILALLAGAALVGWLLASFAKGRRQCA